MITDTLQFQEINERDRWTELVLSARNYTFMHSWEFGEQLAKRGAEITRGVLLAGETPLALIQAHYTPARRGKLLQLRQGPLLLPALGELDGQAQAVAGKFLADELLALAQHRGADYLRLQPLVELEDAEGSAFWQQLRQTGQLEPAQIHNIDAEKTLVLDLRASEEEILANMRKQTRYSIRRAEKDGVTIEAFGQADLAKLDGAVRDFYRIHHDTTVRQQFTSYSESYYRDFVATLQGKDLETKVFLARYQGQFIAGAIVVYYGGKAFYSDGGSLTEFSKIPASYLVQWTAISEAKGRGAHSYNFWGGVSPDRENTNYPWYGIDLFKRGFGGVRVEYLHAHDRGFGLRYKLIRTFEALERRQRGY